MSEEITCRELVELITDYLEGAMAPEDRSRFEEHLSICDGCTNYLGQLRETILIACMLTEEQIPDEQKRSLLMAFRDWKRAV